MGGVEKAGSLHFDTHDMPVYILLIDRMLQERATRGHNQKGYSIPSLSPSKPTALLIGSSSFPPSPHHSSDPRHERADANKCREDTPWSDASSRACLTAFWHTSVPTHSKFARSAAASSTRLKESLPSPHPRSRIRDVARWVGLWAGSFVCCQR